MKGLLTELAEEQEAATVHGPPCFCAELSYGSSRPVTLRRSIKIITRQKARHRLGRLRAWYPFDTMS